LEKTIEKERKLLVQSGNLSEKLIFGIIVFHSSNLGEYYSPKT